METWGGVMGATLPPHMGYFLLLPPALGERPPVWAAARGSPSASSTVNHSQKPVGAKTADHILQPEESRGQTAGLADAGAGRMDTIPG